MSKPKNIASQVFVALDTCLKPFEPEVAVLYDGSLITCDGAMSEQGIEGVVLTAGDVSIDLKVSCTSLEFLRAPSEVWGLKGKQAYSAGCKAIEAEDPDTASVAFGLALNDPKYRVASAYGLACALAMRGAHSECVGLIRLLITSSADHPAFSALAGRSAAAMNDMTQARQHLAHAARIARESHIYRDILRFSQRTLLIQEFGD